MTFAQLLPRYLRHLTAERNASPYTVRNYGTDLAGFQKFLNQTGTPLEMVERTTLRGYLSWLMEGDFSRRSISRKLSALRSFYRYLLREGIVASNPTATTTSPRIEKRLPEFLSAEEARRLVEAPDTSTPWGQRDRALLELLYASGLRVSEVVGLDLDRVDLESRQLRVWGKGAKERMVLMGKPAAAALETYLREGRPKLRGKEKTDALFISRYGKRLVSRRMQYMVDDYARKIGLAKRIHPHMIRHTFATHLLDGNADLRVVQELLGHAQLSSTEVYTHVTQSKARKVYMAAHPGAKEQKEEAL
jgi:integrase/recombinase XerC